MFQVIMHRFLCMTANAECFIVLSPVIMFLPVHMMSVKVFAVGGLSEINATFFIFARPAMFRSIARTGFPEATVIVVQWRSIVGMQWRSGNLIVRISCKILTELKVVTNLRPGLIVHPVVHFIRYPNKAVPTYFKFAYSRICFAEFINKIHLEFAIGSPGDYVLFKLSVLSHFLQRSAIRDMKFGQIVERIVFTRGPKLIHH
jgi:hypothetical protein